MKNEIDFLIKSEKIYENKKYLYYRSKKNIEETRSILVSMATHNGGERYFNLKGLLEKSSFDLLFVKDPKNSYYLGDDGGNSYNKLFSSILSSYSSDNITFFGSSMSGYGALFHASFFNANAIVSNPQLNFEATLQHCWVDLRKTISKIKSPINLDTFEKFINSSGTIHAEFGKHPMDKANFNILNSLKISNLKIVLHDDPTHGYYFHDIEKACLIHKKITSQNNLD